MIAWGKLKNAASLKRQYLPHFMAALKPIVVTHGLKSTTGNSHSKLDYKIELCTGRTYPSLMQSSPIQYAYGNMLHHCDNQLIHRLLQIRIVYHKSAFCDRDMMNDLASRFATPA